jgi:hypothetical protein
VLHQPTDVTLAGAVVIPFHRRTPAAGLSLRDRMEIAAWQGRLHRNGYDRMVIHERTACDPPDVECFVSIYRRGDAWARWGLARCGATVLAWCSVTGHDIGHFGSMAEALEALFPATPAPLQARASAQVIRAFC